MKKNEVIPNTLMLLKMFTQMHTSRKLEVEIAKIIAKSREIGQEELAEKTADQIIKIMNTCKTEEEILEKIQNFQEKKI